MGPPPHFPTLVELPLKLVNIVFYVYLFSPFLSRYSWQFISLWKLHINQAVATIISGFYYESCLCSRSIVNFRCLMSSYPDSVYPIYSDCTFPYLQCSDECQGRSTQDGRLTDNNHESDI